MKTHLKLTVLFSSLVLPTIGMGTELKERFIPKGLTARTEGYQPMQAKLDLDSSEATAVPEGVEEAKFGRIKIQNQSRLVAIANREGASEELWIDANGDNDLTNDPPADWVGREVSGRTQFSGSAMVKLDNGRWGSVRFYRTTASDPSRAPTANVLMYYADYGSEIEFELDGKSFSTLVSGRLQNGLPLRINRDGNKTISRYFEMATIGEPFNFTGTTYVFDLDSDRLRLQVSKESVPQLPLPPDFSIGKSSIPFTGKAIDGAQIEFPKDYAGKLVMLDFWATWCGPCVAEVPHMKKAYAEWHDKGFEILGVCLDKAGSGEIVQKFLDDKEIEWMQLYDDEKKPVEITRDYDILGIPFVLLVDGNSGEILATSRELRGPGLSKTIGSFLENKTEAK